MIKITLTLFILLILSACSLKTPQNNWQIKSTNAFSSYTQNFLSAHDALAKNDLSRAIKHAKQSANLSQLAKIYLGECALNISAGINDACTKYSKISDLIDDEGLDSYYKLLTHSIEEKHIHFLPNQYKQFTESLIKKDFTKANKEIQSIDKLTSALLCASLIKEKTTQETREKLIESASFSGYKRSVLFWLAESKKTASSPAEIQSLDRKISILTSK